MTAMTATPALTAPTTRPASAPDAVRRPRIVDVPSDFRFRTAPDGSSTHRFPAATYLCRNVAREERAIAQQALEAADRTASHRIGGVALVGAALFAAILVLLGTGRAESGSGVLVLALLAAALVLLVVALVTVLRRHEREHDALAGRARMYEARLRELRTRR
ncbi:hypothetical protein GCM10009740_39560 [Terrabacter terrae]|uniref:Uncharacterized protein n=1 Tax=Terrabacter terrae TaxID=318434 RepID=A0ABP4KK73_9MICO